MKHLSILGFSMALLMAGTIHAQDVSEATEITLAQAQSEAEQNSPDLRRLKAAMDAADWKRLEMVSPYVPHLSADASQVLDQRYLYLGIKFGGEVLNFPEAFPSSTVDLNVSETLFDGLEAWHGYRAASLAYDAAKQDYWAADFSTVQQVRLRFYQALAANLLASVADQNILTLQSHLENVQASEQGGSATQFDILRVQSKLEEARAEKLLVDDNVVVSKEAFFQSLGIPSNDARQLKGELPVPDAALIEGQDLSQTARADLQAEELRVEAAKQRQSASAAFWYPHVSIFGQQEYYQYASYDPVIIPSDGFQSAYTIGLNLNWDLFDGGLSLAKQKQAGAMAGEAEESLKEKQLKVPADLEQWHRRYLYNVALFQARQRSQQECEESVRLADLGLQAGTRTHSESLDAETDLFQARAGLVRAQMDAVEASINLELALGRLLSSPTVR